MISKEIYMSEAMANVKPTIDSNGRRPHPSRNEPLEIRIRGAIEDQAYSAEQGKKMFDDSKVVLMDYFRSSLENVGDPQLIHDNTQEALRRLAEVTNAKIVSGKENLEKLPKGSPVFAAVNHYSGYKLMDIEQEDFGVSFEGMDYVVPFPFFYSSIFPVAKELDDYLYDAHQKMPETFGKIQEEAGLLVIPIEGNAYESIKEKTSEMVSKRQNSLIVIFPEGESSGKRNNGSPYDLVKFHGGSFAIAQELGIPVVPVAQFFNPKSGFEVGVLEPVDFSDIPDFSSLSGDALRGARKEYFNQKAEKVREEMQGWLDQRQQAS